MASHFDSISNVCFNRESIRLKVRVVRLWSVPMFNNAAQTSSLEMILVDEQVWCLYFSNAFYPSFLLDTLIFLSMPEI